MQSPDYAQMRIVKTRLMEMVPDFKVFLGVGPHA